MTDHIKDNKAFCMFPWIHLNVIPTGDAMVCCSSDYKYPLGNTKENTLEEIINGPKMNEVRRKMLAGEKLPQCEFCYRHDDMGHHSFRKWVNRDFGKYYDEVMANTNEDGSLKDFKMRYLDVRFSNICNFACRMCGSAFSSTWAQEDKRYMPDQKIAISIHADKSGRLLDEVIEHIDHIDMMYFGGGEPLLMEEQYILIEEVIRRGRTDIVLRYNTNCSNFTFKDKDIFSLWEHFNDVEISASIDHYGERAEYLRYGTDWGLVESNLRRLRSKPNIQFGMNTVLSFFNYVTLADFYQYMMNLGLYSAMDYRHSLIKTSDPKWFSAQNLPQDLKAIGTKKNEKLYDKIDQENYFSKQILREAIDYTVADHKWETIKDILRSNVNSIDNRRGQDFVKTFPELKSMYEE